MADRYWISGNGAWVTAANWSATSGGTGGASVPTSADNVIFDRAATYTVNFSTVVGECANFTVSAGVVSFTASVGEGLRVYGNFSVIAATLFHRNAFTYFSGTSGTQTITTNGANIRSYIQFDGSGTYQLQDNFITSDGSYRNFVTFLSGTLDLNNKQLSTPIFNSSNANVRSIAFGTTGKIVLLGDGAITAITVWDTSTTTNMSTTGTTLVTCANALGTSGSRNFFVGNLPESQAISFHMNGGTFTCGLFFSSGTFKNVNFTGYAGTLNSHGGSPTIYGDLTFSTGMSVNTNSTNGAFVFSGGANQTITSNGKSFCASVTMDKTDGTLTLADALSLETGSTVRVLTFANGTFDGTSKTISSVSASTLSSTGTVTGKNINTARVFTLTSGTFTQGAANTFGSVTLNNGTFDGGGFTTTGAFTMATGSVTAKNIVGLSAFTHTSGTLTFGANNTTGAYTFNAGTLDLAGYQLNPSTFTSNGTGVRTLAFGTGNITCTGSGGTLFNSTSSTNLTVTGTPVVNIPYSGAVATTIAAFPNTEAQSISFNIQAGTYALTMIDASRAYRNVNFTGFSGTLGALGASSVKIYGSLTLSSTMTLTPIANTMTFAGTSTGNTITTAGKVIGYKLAFDGVGGSWILQDALTISGTSCNVRHYNGTLDLNGKTLTLAPETNSYYTDPGTKNLTFNGGTLIATNDFNNANPTGYTTTAGTGVGKISIQKATGFTFTGGGSTYNCTISNDGAGALVISGNNAIQTLTTTVGNITLSGSNAITTITNAVQPVTFTFAIGTTQTITNWNVSGTAGNLVTVISSSIGTPATLSKASGTVSANYLSLRDSAATGGAAWYAGANSTNVSGNSGWIFANAPAGAFFIMF